MCSKTQQATNILDNNSEVGIFLTGVRNVGEPIEMCQELGRIHDLPQWIAATKIKQLESQVIGERSWTSELVIVAVKRVTTVERRAGRKQ